MTDYSRGAAVGTVPGEARYVGTSHVETLPLGARTGQPLGAYGSGAYAAPYGMGAPIGHPGMYTSPHLMDGRLASPERMGRWASPSRSHDLSRAMDQDLQARKPSPNRTSPLRD